MQKARVFWIWDKANHRRKNIETKGNCCFNHIIGLPYKDGKPLPLYEYEHMLHHTLLQSKYLWIKKATGLGVTEFMLRWIAYLALMNGYSIDIPQQHDTHTKHGMDKHTLAQHGDSSSTVAQHDSSRVVSSKVVDSSSVVGSSSRVVGSRVGNSISHSVLEYNHSSNRVGYSRVVYSNDIVDSISSIVRVDRVGSVCSSNNKIKNNKIKNSIYPYLHRYPPPPVGGYSDYTITDSTTAHTHTQHYITSELVPYAHIHTRVPTLHKQEVGGYGNTALSNNNKKYPYSHENYYRRFNEIKSTIKNYYSNTLDDLQNDDNNNPTNLDKSQTNKQSLSSKNAKRHNCQIQKEQDVPDDILPSADSNKAQEAQGHISPGPTAQEHPDPEESYGDSLSDSRFRSDNGGSPVIPPDSLALGLTSETNYVDITDEEKGRYQGPILENFDVLQLRFLLDMHRQGFQPDQHFCIVTGPRLDLSIGLIDRFKSLFLPHGVVFDTKNTVCELNGVRIEAFPSHHLDSMRGIPNPKFILLDESDFFPKSEQDEARAISERYIAKSNPVIVMVSTPYMPGGLFERIEMEQDSLYSKIFLHYKVGLDKIFSKPEIAVAKRSPSFPREYELEYGYGIGNLFPDEVKINQAISTIPQLSYMPDDQLVNHSVPIALGIDPAFGSSKFAFVVLRLSPTQSGQVQVVYAEEFERIDFQRAIEIATDILAKYNPHRIYVDAANPGFIQSLKIQIGEREDYANIPKDRWANSFRVLPVNFGLEHRKMLTHLQNVVSEGLLQVHPRFHKLIGQMRSAKVKENGTLDKDYVSLDLIDALRLCLQHFPFEPTEGET